MCFGLDTPRTFHECLTYSTFNLYAEKKNAADGLQPTPLDEPVCLRIHESDRASRRRVSTAAYLPVSHDHHDLRRLRLKGQSRSAQGQLIIPSARCFLILQDYYYYLLLCKKNKFCKKVSQPKSFLQRTFSFRLDF